MRLITRRVALATSLIAFAASWFTLGALFARRNDDLDRAGYETRLDAISAKDNTPVTVVQWLRFGGQGALRIIGSSPREQWAQAFPRFRAVRDGIQPP